ncbi:MAG: 50S ribosomal protein L20 [bacterium]|nr:50S ribosomal protein L20 [bacterium]
MPRVKRGTMVRKRHKKMLALTKGYRHGRNNLFKRAKEAFLKAGQHAFRDRRTKKREFRKLWIIKINAAARLHGMTYSELIPGLQKAKINLDRKVLAELAVSQPEEFSKIVEKVKTQIATK